MKRCPQSLLLVCALLCLGSGSAHADGRVVRVGLFPVEPLLFVVDGEPRGFYVDLLAEVARDEDWQLEYVRGTWDENLDRLARGTIDLLPTMAHSAERDSFVDFTAQQVIMLWTQVYVDRDADVSNILDLAGRRVAIMKGDINGRNFLDYVAGFGVDCEVVEVASLEDVFHAVVNREAEAGVAPNVFGYTHAKSHGLKASPIIFSPYTTHFGVPKGTNGDVLQALDLALARWQAEDDSIFQRRLDHWFGGGRFESTAAPQWLLAILGAIAGIAVLLVVWVRLLNHQVQRQTRDLRSNEKQYRILFETAGDSILIMEGDRFVECNERTLEVFGCRREEIIGEAPTRFSPPVQPDGQDSAAAAGLRIAAVKENCAEIFEWRHRRLDGTEFDAEVSLTGLHVDGRSFTQAIVRDVTERKQLEADLGQAQKMEAIGTLAGGIAHDFNNILSAILGYAELARLDAEGNPGLSANIDQVMRASERARDLVQQILAFSRRAVENRHPMEIAPIVTEILQLLRSSIPSNITIEHELRTSGPVQGDPTSIYQVLMNLCTNASQAMGSRSGLLKIVLREAEVGSGGELPAGRYVVIEVRDTGPGMDVETRDKIFEPYFTTRISERGTGLGLAVVHGIVEEHGGRVEVESREGEGSLFRIHLPFCEQATHLTDPEHSVTEPHGTESILLVDDEEDIVEICRRGLERMGYKVRGCTDSHAALELFKANPLAFDLLVTDMKMPGMSGLVLAAAVREIRHDTPVILCTGFADGITSGSAVEMGVSAFLMKPLVVTDLAAAVRGALSGAPV